VWILARGSARGFFIRLALTNLSRNRRMQLPHFIASTIIVSVYFMVTTIIYTRSISNINYSQSLQDMFAFGMVVMTILIFPFMLYINSFLIKQRKKEFGLYAILGLEKRHVGRVIFWENLISSVSAMALGIVSGCVFGRLIFMLLLFALNAMASGSRFTIPWQAFAYTCALFLVIFVVTTLYNLLHVRLATPIDLLKGPQKGEKKVRFVVPLALVGAGLLAWAYYTSFTVSNAISALTRFFIAVIAVIIATFLLFIAGSQLLLRLLRKNKEIYYRPNNFVAISGMFHRMKQNAAGLASICILSTMVLVTVSTCISLYLGREDMLRMMYPDDITLTIEPRATEEEFEELDALLETLERENDVKIVDRCSYTYFHKLLIYEDGRFKVAEDTYFAAKFSLDDVYEATIIPLDDYNSVCGDDEILEPGEVLVLTEVDPDDRDSFRVGSAEYRIKRIVSGTRFTNRKYSIKQLFLVTKDLEAAANLQNEMDPKSYRVSDASAVMAFDVEGSQDDALNFARALIGRGLPLEAVTWVNAIHTNRLEGYALYGGLLFLGIFFTILFLTATVLIIYFKQVSEGYDDKERFEILQKVGMDDVEVRRTINKQILIAFFLPLAGALIHLLAASNMIIKLLELFSLYNHTLTAICLAATCLVFAFVYAVVYRLTAGTYYRIVRRVMGTRV
jgi:putative ABC transport system permease protein